MERVKHLFWDSLGGKSNNCVLSTYTVQADGLHRGGITMHTISLIRQSPTCYSNLKAHDFPLRLWNNQKQNFLMILWSQKTRLEVKWIQFLCLFVFYLTCF